MDNCLRSPEFQRPEELLPVSACKQFLDFAISCYFATHAKATEVSVAQLELCCSRFNVRLTDEITVVDAT